MLTLYNFDKIIDKKYTLHYVFTSTGIARQLYLRFCHPRWPPLKTALRMLVQHVAKRFGCILREPSYLMATLKGKSCISKTNPGRKKILEVLPPIDENLQLQVTGDFPSKLA